MREEAMNVVATDFLVKKKNLGLVFKATMEKKNTQKIRNDVIVESNEHDQSSIINIWEISIFHHFGPINHW